MTNIIKRITKRSEVKKKENYWCIVVFEYTGNECEVPKDVTHVRFHKDVVKVDSAAFKDCTQLKEVVLNEGLNIIGKGAFQRCTSLESIVLPSTVTDIGVGAFIYCTQLRRVVLNNGLMKIRKQAFRGCSSLVTIELPATITEVGERAFKYCSALKELVLNEGLEIIVQDAFTHCTSLVTIKLPSTIIEIEERAFHNCKMLKEVVLNEGLLMIGKESFWSCNSLQSITLPATVTEIDANAFVKCENLRTVVLANKGRLQKMKIGDYAFQACKSLLSIDLSDTLLIEIPSDTFSNCIHLKDVVLNEGINNIRQSAFHGCTSLQSINLPSSLDEIGCNAFRRCKKLKEVVLNGGLKKIGRWAFANCDILEIVTIPPTVTDIGYCAFGKCRKLKKVELTMETLYRKNVDSKAFIECISLERFTFQTISTRLNTIINASRTTIKKKKKNTWWPQLIHKVPLSKQTEVEAKIDEIRGLVERRGSEICVPESHLVLTDGKWKPRRLLLFGMPSHRLAFSIRISLAEIDRLISHYEMIEGTILFALALWKAKMGQADVVISATDRDAYRIDVPGPVKNTIMQFLFSENLSDIECYSDSSSYDSAYSSDDEYL